MNRLVEKKLTELNQLLTELREFLDERARAEESAQSDRQRILQEQWKQQRELVALRRAAKDYDALEEELKTLESAKKAIQEGLRRLLGHTRALARELRQ